MSREVCGICWCPYDEETGKCACPPPDVAHEALFLAKELESPLGTVISSEVDRRAAKELRRLHAELERCQKVCAATSECWRIDDANHRRAQAAIYFALGTENSDRDTWPDEIRALRNQRDALLGALKAALPLLIGKPYQLAIAAIAAVEDKK